MKKLQKLIVVLLLFASIMTHASSSSNNEINANRLHMPAEVSEATKNKIYDTQAIEHTRKQLKNVNPMY